MSDQNKSKKSKFTNKYNFVYVARDHKHNKVKGEIYAENKTVAQSILRKEGLIDITLTLYREPSFLVNFFTKKKVKFEDITAFTRQLSTMQTAGLPLVQALKVVIESSDKPSLVKLISKLKQEVESGGSFSECLRYHPQNFDELYCNLVEAGESSGNLDLMLQRIATYREKTESLKRKLKKAMYYPITVLLIAAGVTALLLVKVVPTFKSMFEGFGAELPAYTQFVLNLSDSLTHSGVKFIATIIALWWVTSRLYKSNRRFRNTIQRLTLRLPIFGSLIHKAAIARIAQTLATTFAAGVPLPEALTLVARSSGNIVFQNAITQIRDSVIVGKRISLSMKETKVFPPLVVQMVAIGEETGSLDAMLQKVATIYMEEVDTAVDGLSTLMEPLIMLILGIIVGGLVIAMYLPIFKLGSVF